MFIRSLCYRFYTFCVVIFERMLFKSSIVTPMEGKEQEFVSVNPMLLFDCESCCYCSCNQILQFFLFIIFSILLQLGR